MGFLNWFQQKQAEENSTNEQMKTKSVAREAFIQNDYYVEVEVFPPLGDSNCLGFWFYTIYDYFEDTGKGRVITVSSVQNGNKELALFVARNHVNILCQQGKMNNG